MDVSLLSTSFQLLSQARALLHARVVLRLAAACA